MEALSTFLSRPGTPHVFWQPRAGDLHQQEATGEEAEEGRAEGGGKAKEKKRGERGKGRVSSQAQGHRDINLILDLFKTREKTQETRLLRLKDFRRVFGQKDKLRHQMGVPTEDLDLIFNDVFEFIDKDRKNYLTIDDFLKTLFRRLSKAQIEELKYTFRAEIGEEEEEKELPALSEEQVSEMRELFQIYAKGEERMDFDVFEAAISESWAVKPSRQEMIDYFNEADRKQKGHITLADFINWLQRTLWVDFMDLSKGSTQSFRKYMGPSWGRRRQRRSAFVEEGVQEVKTLLDLVPMDNGRKKVSRDFVFEQKHLIGHKATLQRITGQQGPAHSTLAYPVGPIWRPPVQVNMRRHTRTSTPAATGYDQNGRRVSVESLGRRSNPALNSRPSTSHGAHRSLMAPPEMPTDLPRRPWTADGSFSRAGSQTSSGGSSRFSRAGSRSSCGTAESLEFSRVGSRASAVLLSRPSTAASVRRSLPDSPASTRVQRLKTVQSTKEDHALAPMCVVPMHAAQTRQRVLARQGGNLLK